jgi:hypothetical protein
VTRGRKTEDDGLYSAERQKFHIVGPDSVRWCRPASSRPPRARSPGSPPDPQRTGRKRLMVPFRRVPKVLLQIDVVQSNEPVTAVFHVGQQFPRDKLRSLCHPWFVTCFTDCHHGIPDYPACVLKPGRRFQDEKRITITTLQSMINIYRGYSSGYFDLVITDE